MLRITFVFFLCGFFLFRPFQMQKVGMLYPGDDRSYFAYSTAFVFGEYPSFEKEWVDEFAVPPLSRVGHGIMAAPFVALFSIVDRLQEAPILKERTRETILPSWSVFGALLASVIYAWLSCWLLYIALRGFVSKTTASTVVILMVMCQGALLYAFRRPVFSHVPELFLQSLGFFFFTQKLIQPTEVFSRSNRTRFFWLCVFSLITAFMLLIRQNSVVYAFLWPVAFFCFTKQGLQFKQWKEALASCVMGFGIYWTVKYYPYWLQPEKYAQANAAFETSAFMFQWQSLHFYCKRFLTVFFGMDWGLVFTAPFLILGTAALFLKDLPWQRYQVLLALPLLINLYILIIWKGQGSWYGYRYLLFAAIPVLSLPLAFLIENLTNLNRKYLYFFFFIAIPPTVSMLVFEGSPGTIIEPITTEFGENNVGNLRYQIEAWKLVVPNPWHFFYTFLKAGPAYVGYAAANLLGFAERLPLKFSELYDSFEIRTLIQTLMVYLTPWLMYWGYRRNSGRL